MNRLLTIFGASVVGWCCCCLGSPNFYTERPNIQTMSGAVYLASWCSRAQVERHYILSTNEYALLPWSGSQSNLIGYLKLSISQVITNFVDVTAASGGTYNDWFADGTNTTFPHWSSNSILNYLELPENFYGFTPKFGGIPESNEWTAVHNIYAMLKWTSTHDSWWRIINVSNSLMSGFVFMTNTGYCVSCGQSAALDLARASAVSYKSTNVFYLPVESHIIASSSHHGCVWYNGAKFAAKYGAAEHDIKAYPGATRASDHFACDVDTYLRPLSKCVQNYDELFWFTNYVYYCRPQLSGELSCFTNACVIYTNLVGYTNAFALFGSGQAVYFGTNAPPRNTFCDSYLQISSENVSYESTKSTFVYDSEDCSPSSTDAVFAYIFQTVGAGNCHYCCPPEDYIQPGGEYELSLEVEIERDYEVIHILRWEAVEDESIVYY